MKPKTAIPLGEGKKHKPRIWTKIGLNSESKSPLTSLKQKKNLPTIFNIKCKIKWGESHLCVWFEVHPHILLYSRDGSIKIWGLGGQILYLGWVSMLIKSTHYTIDQQHGNL